MHIIAATLSLWVVLYQQDIPPESEQSLAHSGGTVVARLPEIGALVVAADANFASRAAADPDVAYIVQDLEVQMIPDARAVTAAPMPEDAVIGRAVDPMYRLQWDKQRINASMHGSYAVQRGHPEVLVAVLDTGAEATHPDIAPNLATSLSRSFYPVQDDPHGVADPKAWDDRNGHGTWCLSAVAAPINGTGISGVAPRVSTVALKVLGDNGVGSFVSLAQALLYSARRFDIVSMSLIGYLRRGDPNHEGLRELVQRAVTRARESGVTVFAALGNAAFDINDPDFLAMYMPIPAELDGVIGVSATNYFDEKASYSNYGFDITDIAAPGGDLGVVPESGFEGDGALLGAWAPDSSTNPGAMYAWLQGTSMACPNAAGVAALIVSQYGDFSPYRMRGPHLAPKIVENYLRQSAFPLNDERYYGAGLVDALGAVTIERMERTAAPPSGR